MVTQKPQRLEDPDWDRYGRLSENIDSQAPSIGRSWLSDNL